MKKMKLNYSRMRQAVRLFRSDLVSREVNKANRIAWLRCIERMGNKWVLAVPVRKEM
jgi:hypothetical protein